MKRYRDYNSYLREIFGERVHKISLDAGLSCPNRDGSISTKGCIFCDPRGSGTGAKTIDGLTIKEQIERALPRIKRRYGAKKFIAYFQSFSNTYGSPELLETLYSSALYRDDIVGLSIATRPDCVDRERLEIISRFKERCLLWLEYGLQSSQDSTLGIINRGHDSSCFEDAVIRTSKYGIAVCAHVILGLPGESSEMMLDTARFLADLPVSGVKIHLLYILEGTQIANMYRKGEFRCLEQDEYVQMVVDFLELLPEDMVIQRLTGDPPGSELIAPAWAREKNKTLDMIKDLLERRDSWQGKLFRKFSAGK